MPQTTSNSSAGATSCHWAVPLVLFVLNLVTRTNCASSSFLTDTYANRRRLTAAPSVARALAAVKPNVSQINIVFIKTPKTASSTTGGLARRIGARHGHSGVQVGRSDLTLKDDDAEITEPGVWAAHSNRSVLEEQLFPSLTLPTFIFTFIRNPVSRCLSQFYHFKVARASKWNSSEYNKLLFMKKSGACSSSRMFRYLSPTRDPNMHTVDDILKAFDFIGDVDNYDESVVLLAHLLKIDLTDVLYLSSKVNDGNMIDPKTGNAVETFHPPLSEEPAAVQDFAKSDEFHKRNAKDFALVKRVSERIKARFKLDPRLRQRAIEFQRLRERAKQRCGKVHGYCGRNNNAFPFHHEIDGKGTERLNISDFHERRIAIGSANSKTAAKNQKIKNQKTAICNSCREMKTNACDATNLSCVKENIANCSGHVCKNRKSTSRTKNCFSTKECYWNDSGCGFKCLDAIANK
jgi:hypothetical protein